MKVLKTIEIPKMTDSIRDECKNCKSILEICLSDVSDFDHDNNTGASLCMVCDHNIYSELPVNWIVYMRNKRKPFWTK